MLSHGSCDGHLMKLELKRAGLDPERDVAYRELWQDYNKIDGLASGELFAQLIVERGSLWASGKEPCEWWSRPVELNPIFNGGFWCACEILSQNNQSCCGNCCEDILRAPDTVPPILRNKAMICEYTPGYEPATVERALTRTLPIWNTTGLIDMDGLAVAVETMCTLGAIPSAN